MQHRYFLTSHTAFLILLTIATPATAALTPVLGGLGVYDSDQDITWLANANAGAGSSFDDGSNTIDGRMKWASANAWAASLNIAGFTNWRLPEMDINGDGTVVDCAVVIATECLDNEYGYHFYVNGIDTTNSGLFGLIPTNDFWSATASSASEAWLFDFTFNDGSQLTSSVNLNAYAWAVHEGNIGAVPIPAAVWLFGSGLLALIGAVIRKKAA